MSQVEFPKKLVTFCKEKLLREPAKRVVISGPSGFLGSRVVWSALDVHALRQEHGLPPGEIVLLSASPGKLMDALVKKYGRETMKTIRASRVDYRTQHDVDTWIDQLGALGLEGENCVFVNLAAIAERRTGGLGAVNYQAPLAAANACAKLGWGHWVQSSTQAVNAERGGQVPYSRGKAMADFALSRIEGLPVSIATLGLLYRRSDMLVGQSGSALNLIDLPLLPLTPILGSGRAPLQPQEVSDAAERIAYLAFTDPALRPASSGTYQGNGGCYWGQASINMGGGCKPGSRLQQPTVRRYDAVGPEKMTMLELLTRFARYQGNRRFRPVHIGYDNMEEILERQSLGNLNRMFVSLLRSEQESDSPIIGDPSVWDGLLGDHPDSRMLSLDAAFQEAEMASAKKRKHFPYWKTVFMVLQNPRIIWPGVKLSLEIVTSFAGQLSDALMTRAAMRFSGPRSTETAPASTHAASEDLGISIESHSPARARVPSMAVVSARHEASVEEGPLSNEKDLPSSAGNWAAWTKQNAGAAIGSKVGTVAHPAAPTGVKARAA